MTVEQKSNNIPTELPIRHCLNARVSLHLNHLGDSFILEDGELCTRAFALVVLGAFLEEGGGALEGANLVCAVWGKEDEWCCGHVCEMTHKYPNASAFIESQ